MTPILISRLNGKRSAKLYMLAAAISMIPLGIASVSCSTTAGFGRDVQKAGDQIEKAARR